jgi:hypothetical protein
MDSGHGKLNSWKGEFIMTNTKKKKGNKMKLLSAVGMLTVSAAMLVSSTFAWFSLNRTVRAQTMTVQAKSADPFLKISANGDDFFTALDATANTSNDTGAWAIQTQAAINGNAADDAKLKLIAPKTIGSTMEWVWNQSSNPNSPNTQNVSTGTGNKAVTLEEKAANKNTDRSAIMTGKVAGETLEDAFVLKQTLTFQNIAKDSAGTNLKIDSVTITRDATTKTPASTFDKAVRVLVVNENGKYALYNGEGALIAAENGATGTAMDKTTASGTDPAKAIIAAKLDKESTTNITIYMYFDGNADQAFTNNAYDLTGVHAAFQFSIDSETATNP